MVLNSENEQCKVERGAVLTVQEKQILKKTDNVSIRIDSELSRKLHDQCIEQKISLNTLINHLLDKQVNWHNLATEMGWITMFRTTFIEISDSIPKDKIEKIAETTGTTDLKNALNYIYGYIDLESVLDFFKKGCNSMNVQFREMKINGKNKIIIHHNLGKNWPIFMVSQMNEILNEIEYRIINQEFNKQGFSFEITKVETQ